MAIKYSYNGRTLTKFPDTNFPYVLIGYTNNTGYYAICTTVPVCVDEYFLTWQFSGSTTTYGRYTYYVDSESWVYSFSSSSFHSGTSHGAGLYAGGIFWANHDVYYINEDKNGASGNICVAASTPTLVIDDTATLIPLPSHQVPYSGGAGATGITIGAQVSMDGETIDISDEAHYECSAFLSLDANRQLILANELVKWGAITITWDELPGQSASVIIYNPSNYDPDNPDGSDPDGSDPDPDEPQEAETPTILSCGNDATYYVGDDAETLVCEAEVSDGGTLSYQWYKDDYPVSKKASCSVDTHTAGEFHYYCVVTNTLGDSTAEATSDTVTITVLEKRAETYYTASFQLGIAVGLGLTGIPKTAK